MILQSLFEVKTNVKYKKHMIVIVVVEVMKIVVVEVMKIVVVEVT